MHDVAVIQAALTNANLPGAGRGFWKGRIDGRKSPALDEAICAFQQAARVTVTGRIGQSGTDTNKLEGALPHTHKAMRAVASTAAVWRTSGRAKRFAEVAKAAEASPFPKAERTALAAIAKRSAQSFGLGVELEDAAVTPDGRFRARLGVPDIEWLDAGGTRFQKERRRPGRSRARCRPRRPRQPNLAGRIPTPGRRPDRGHLDAGVPAAPRRSAAHPAGIIRVAAAESLSSG